MADSQWQKTYDRGVYESDRSYNYQKDRDKVSDSQWAQEFALQKKLAVSRSRGSSGDGNYLGSRTSSSSDSNGQLSQETFDKAASQVGKSDLQKLLEQGAKAVRQVANKKR